jgi:nucleoside 2-deoxyribosyltransferase
MKIYIAASWKHQHAVEMLTALLRNNGHEIFSFVENNYGEGHSATKPMPFEDWMKTAMADRAFVYDTNSAMLSDLVIYIGPSGKDAAAELGMAYAKNVPIIGLWAKGEDFGLMRKMMWKWCDRYTEVLDHVERYNVEMITPYNECLI